MILHIFKIRWICLNWKTETETNNHGFEIERKFKNQDWQIIGFIEGNGTTTEPQLYNFNDDFSLLPYEGTVLYRLKQIDYDGSFDYSQQVAVDVNLIPTDISISQNYPNPFNPSTTIEYSLPNESRVKILIYNSIGEVIENLVSEIRNEGTHQAVWKADKFPSGVYFYSFEVTETSGNATYLEMKKIVLMK